MWGGERTGRGCTAELEALLLTHPAVQDSAVIPIPNEEAGEVHARAARGRSWRHRG